MHAAYNEGLVFGHSELRKDTFSTRINFHTVVDKVLFDGKKNSTITITAVLANDVIS